ncbi:unnamed protein product [Prunus brigantina]
MEHLNWVSNADPKLAKRICMSVLCLGNLLDNGSREFLQKHLDFVEVLDHSRTSSMKLTTKSFSISVLMMATSSGAKLRLFYATGLLSISGMSDGDHTNTSLLL